MLIAPQFVQPPLNLRILIMHLLKSLLLLQVAFAIAVSAGKPAARPLFDEWLEQKTAAVLPASAKPSSVAPKHYDELETEVLCLKVLEERNCRSIGCTDACFPGGGCLAGVSCFSRAYIEASFTCCQPEDYLQYGYDYDYKPRIPAELANFEIGDCQVTVNMVSNYINVTKGVFKSGTYSMHCAVKQGGEYCGHPFCDSLSWNSQGTTWWLSQGVISMTNPTMPTMDEPCTNIAAMLWQQAEILSGNQGEARVLAKKALDIPGPGPTSYYQGGAIILEGPMSITSRKFDVKYHEGQFHYEYFYADPTNPMIDAAQAEAAGMLLVNPPTITLKLVKPRSY